jgi:hypothetical protein
MATVYNRCSPSTANTFCNLNTLSLHTLQVYGNHHHSTLSVLNSLIFVWDIRLSVGHIHCIVYITQCTSWRNRNIRGIYSTLLSLKLTKPYCNSKMKYQKMGSMIGG